MSWTIDGWDSRDEGRMRDGCNSVSPQEREALARKRGQSGAVCSFAPSVAQARRNTTQRNATQIPPPSDHTSLQSLHHRCRSALSIRPSLRIFQLSKHSRFVSQSSHLPFLHFGLILLRLRSLLGSSDATALVLEFVDPSGEVGAFPFLGLVEVDGEEK